MNIKKVINNLIKYRLYFVVFACGTSTMAFELVGSRLMSPYFGNSIIVWTAIIGIIMAGLSCGYWLGGRLADGKPEYEYLSYILFISFGLVCIVFLIYNPVGRYFSENRINLLLTSFMASIIIFLPTSFFLGMVSPYAIRLSLKDIKNSGVVVGNLYALSTVGSIIGTFGAGYYLLSVISSSRILFIIAFLLLFCAFIVLPRKKLFFMSSLFLVFYFLVGFWIPDGMQFSGGKILADQDSQYNRILVIDTNEQRPRRIVMTDFAGVQSGIYKDDGSYSNSYMKYYEFIESIKPGKKSNLMIGGGALTYANYYIKNYSGTMDVVEIDKKFIDLAKEYFNFENNGKIKIINQDGRIYLNNNHKQYEVVLNDAFNQTLTVPFHLTTRQSMKKINDSLTSDGVAVFNLISAVDGSKSKFFKSEYLTISKVFDEVVAFQVNNESYQKTQNIVIFAVKDQKKFENSLTNKQLWNDFKKEEIKPSLEGIKVLDDNFAPVEKMVMVN